MRGRKPKPTLQKLNEGDAHHTGVRKLAAKAASEPKAERGLPPCPSHLTGRARQAWKFWAVALELMGLDRRPDAMMLEGACVAYARAVQADLMLADAGPVCVLDTVDVQTQRPIQKLKAHPSVAISNKSWLLVKAFCSEFGLSPVSRTRLAIEKGTTKSEDLMKMLSQPREKRSAVPTPTVN